jgi:hypothetical protein
MNRTTRARLALAATALLAADAAAQDFRVIALPDTQNYSKDYPQLYFGQTQWIADRLAADNIRFVSHLGDIVNDAQTQSQWSVAKQAMTTLDTSGVPYGTCPGNHDFRYPGDFFDPEGTSYRANFGPQVYAGKPWYRGHSPSELSNYQIIEVDGTEYLFLHLSVETPPEELAWAQGVLNQHRDKPTWVTTHRYLFLWGPLGAGRYDDFNYFFEPPYVPDGVKADDFYQNFIAANRQVYLVHCGHNDGEYRQTSTNNFGLPVQEVLADYQTSYGNGGNGWLRIIDFRPDQDRLDVQTYSPTLNSFRTGSESQFSLSVDFDQYVTGSSFVKFQDGLGGYDGTVDTWIGEDDPGATHGGEATLVVDDDTANSWFSDYPSHGLLRFNGMFRGPVLEGEPEPTEIPLGATIENATLTLNLSDDTDLSDPDFYLYRMTVGWGNSATWNSLAGGVNPGVDTAPQLIGLFKGDNASNNDFSRAVDLTSAVAAWAAGAPNQGIAILPEIINGFDDGIEIRSSEDGTQALRPSLSVEFSYERINVAPTVTQQLSAATLQVELGDEVDLVFAASDPNPLDPLTFRIDGVDVGFATGSGQVAHPVLFEALGTYTFTAEVADDEAVVPAGQLVIQVVPRRIGTGTVNGPIGSASY